MSKAKPICEATLCGIPFKVYAIDFGGSFDCGTRELFIGMSRGSWKYTLGVLLHEATECAYALKDMRFSNPSHYCSHDSFVFQFDHHKFSDATYEVSEFLSVALEPVYRAWKFIQKRNHA